MGTINIIRRHEQLSTFLCQNITRSWNNTVFLGNITIVLHLSSKAVIVELSFLKGGQFGQKSLQKKL